MGVAFCHTGTNKAISNMEMAIITPSTTNRARQPQMGMSHCTGKVAANLPKEPVISIQELVRS